MFLLIQVPEPYGGGRSDRGRSLQSMYVPARWKKHGADSSTDGPTRLPAQPRRQHAAVLFFSGSRLLQEGTISSSSSSI